MEIIKKMEEQLDGTFKEVEHKVAETKEEKHEMLMRWKEKNGSK
jgi:hypothetical protein